MASTLSFSMSKSRQISSVENFSLTLASNALLLVVVPQHEDEEDEEDEDDEDDEDDDEDEEEEAPLPPPLRRPVLRFRVAISTTRASTVCSVINFQIVVSLF